MELKKFVKLSNLMCVSDNFLLESFLFFNYLIVRDKNVPFIDSVWSLPVPKLNSNATADLPEFLIEETCSELWKIRP